MEAITKFTKTIKVCEVCGSDSVKTVIDMGSHPLCDDLVPIGDERKCIEFPVELLFCNNCFTAHQKYQIDKEKLFPETYHYRARFTSDVLKGMEDLVDSCERVIGKLSNKKILDIGCNDGSLLNFFKLKSATTIGVEPTGAIDDASKDHILYKEYFDKEIAEKIFDDHGFMDVITFTNVFAHIDDLNTLIKNLRKLISSKTILIVENHYLGSIIENYQFDTFYHEHPRTYSLKSFCKIAEKLDSKIIKFEFPQRYGGNIRVFISKNNLCEDESKINLNKVLKKEEQFNKDFKVLNKFLMTWKKTKKNEIDKLVSKFGPLFAKAFPGRASIFIKLLGLNENHIKCILEKSGSKKIGNFVPGTRIPIISDEELFKKDKFPPVIINMAWHISEEINSFMKMKGFNGEIIDIFESK